MSRKIGAWLLLGAFMIFVQVVIGGITRLTGSGLSITKWEIVTGSVPPLNRADWESEFQLYKATPQYQKINEGMDLKSFKFIYFWEYFHRLWARIMGFVFAIPFVYFLMKKQISRSMIWNLVGVIVLASVVAGFGWIMVQSGLVDKPWVSPFKLTIHLGLALLLFGYVLALAFQTLIPKKSYFKNLTSQKSIVTILLILLVLQVLLGGMMSGMKAGLNFPTYPKMNSEWFPTALAAEYWSWQAFIDYNSSTFASAFVQFFHRTIAILLLVVASVFSIRLFSKADSPLGRSSSAFLLLAVFFQFALGVITILSCKGQIPVFWGVMHQAFALVLISAIVLNVYISRLSLR